MTAKLVKDLETAVEMLNSWKGHLIRIQESLSRHRNRPFGHDRHFATNSVFSLRLEYVGCAISGSVLTLDGKITNSAACYQMTVDAMVAVDFNDNAMVIVEHFEHETERRSTIERCQL